MTLWVMALGERDASKGEGYADIVSPVYARASAILSDFGDVFGVIRRWRSAIGEDITVYVMSTLEIADGIPAYDTYDAWDEFGPEIRIDTLPGGYVRMSDYRQGDESADRAWGNLSGTPLDEKAPEV